MKKNLLYRVSLFNDALVFVPPEKAEYVASIHRTLTDSHTWGDFKRKMPSEEYDWIIDSRFENFEEPEPKPTD